MTGCQIRKTLREGGRVYGTAVLGTSPHWVPAVRLIGLDFVFIDTEHTPIDRLTCAWMIQAYEASGLATFVRIRRPDPYLVRETLDAGASAVVVPYVETAETVRELSAAVRYRPLKGKLLEEALDGANRSPVPEAYLQTYNRDRLLVVNMESRPAFENRDEILRVQGLDGILIGPHDLSVSLGCPEDYDHPEFLRTVDEIITSVRAQGIAVGIHSWLDLEQEARWIRTGTNIIVHSSDVYAARTQLTAEISALREAVEERDLTAPLDSSRSPS